MARSKVNSYNIDSTLSDADWPKRTPDQLRHLTPPATKRSRTITISSGGKKRDDALNPIIASVKRKLIALASEHGNRKVATDKWNRSVADLSTDELVVLRDAILKYNENHDEQGRFAEAPGSPIDGTYKSEMDKMPRLDRTIDGYRNAAQYLEDRTGTTLSVSMATRPEDLARGLSTFVALHDRFPSVPPVDINSNFPYAVQHPGVMAWTANNEITLAETYWTGGSKSIPTEDNGWHPNGCSSPEGSITHEFGHLVDAEIQRSPSLKDYAAQLDAITKTPVSGYGGKSQEENFAELFSAAYTPGSSEADSLQSIMFREIVEGAMKGPNS